MLVDVIELIQVVFVVSYLGFNSYLDIRYRFIFGGIKLNLIIGVIGLLLVSFRYYLEPSFDFLFIIIAFTFTVILFTKKRIPKGDTIIILVTCTILPSTQTFEMFSLLSVIIAVVFTMVSYFSYNVILNTVTVTKNRQIFSDTPFSKSEKLLGIPLVRNGFYKK